MNKIEICAKDVYGTTKFYPICEMAKGFAKIAGTKTLTPQVINYIKQMGFEIDLKTFQVAI